MSADWIQRFHKVLSSDRSSVPNKTFYYYYDLSSPPSHTHKHTTYDLWSDEGGLTLSSVCVALPATASGKHHQRVQSDCDHRPERRCAVRRHQGEFKKKKKKKDKCSLNLREITCNARCSPQGGDRVHDKGDGRGRESPQRESELVRNYLMQRLHCTLDYYTARWITGTNTLWITHF